MKRFAVVLATTGLVATSLVTTSLAGPASAEMPANAANLTVTPPPAIGFNGIGAKKAIVTWDDWTQTVPGFEAYWVVADDDVDFVTEGSPRYGPFDTDRGRFVSVGAERSVLFDDLTAGSTYHVAVYAINYTEAGVEVVSPTAVANTPIGYQAAEGAILSIGINKSNVLGGSAVTVSGVLTSPGGTPLGDKTVTIYRDAYPNNLEKDLTPVSVTTNGAGVWSREFKPTINTRFWARYIPTTGIGGWTKNVAVEVRKPITMAVSPSTTITAGKELTFSGKVKANASLIAGQSICWQRYTNKWGGGNCAATIAGDGTYVIKLSPGANADGKYRVWSGLGQAYGNSWSTAKKIIIN